MDEALPLAEQVLAEAKPEERSRLRTLVGGPDAYFRCVNVIAALSSERARAQLLKLPYPDIPRL